MRKTAFKNLKILKGCLPQILLGLFLNTLSHISIFFYCKQSQSEPIPVRTSKWKALQQEVIHLVRTQNQHFLLPDTHTYVKD